jgi:DNA repair exonuclease SbcCD nuclease subunit
MSFKFIHAADLHIDSPLRGLVRYQGAPVDEIRGATRKAVENLINLAIAEGVQFVLIAGDVYDGDWRDFNTGLFFNQQMSKLREYGIPVYIIKGNHDAKSSISKSLTLPSNVYDFDTRNPETKLINAIGVAIHGQGFPDRAVPENLSEAFPDALPGLFNIGLLHTSATGLGGHETYAPCSVDDLKSKGYDYWALGHVHQRQQLSALPYIVFPGNTQGRNIREVGSKGCTLVSVEDQEITSVEHHQLDVMRWTQCEVDVSSSNNLQDLLDCIRIQVVANEAVEDRQALVAMRLTIRGVCDAHKYLVNNALAFENEVRGMLNDAVPDRLWLERLIVQTRPAIDLTQALQNDDVIGQLLRYVRSASSDENLQAEISKELKEIRNKLPPDLWSDGGVLQTDGASILTSLIPDVENDLLGRLSGQEVSE